MKGLPCCRGLLTRGGRVRVVHDGERHMADSEAAECWLHAVDEDFVENSVVLVASFWSGETGGSSACRATMNHYRLAVTL